MAHPETHPGKKYDKMEQEECLGTVGNTSHKMHILPGVKVKGVSDKY